MTKLNFGWLDNIKTKFKLGKNNYRETKELVCDLKQKLGYKDVKININDKNNVTVIGKNNANYIQVNMDFATKKMLQKEFRKDYILFPFLPHQENTLIIKGTTNGDVKRVKNVNLRFDDKGNYREVTDIENKISGNIYRRTRTPNATTYEKLVNGSYVDLFHV